MDHRLAMEGLGEEVDRRGGYGDEGALIAEPAKVARQGRGVAGDVCHGAGGRGGDEVDRLGGEARARRVDHQEVGFLVRKLANGVAAYYVDVVQTGDLEVAP